MALDGHPAIVYIANVRTHSGYIMREKDREKFVELANKRVNNAIKAIQLIGNLSNKSNYDYTEEDISEIFAALNRELKSCRDRFNSPNGKRKPSFQLK